MDINRKISNYNQESRDGTTIKFIVIHFVGEVSSARNNAIYFAGGNRNAGAHYFVDNEIWQSVGDGKAAWHCGAAAPYNQNIGGGSMYKKCNNYNSIGIEMCLKSYKGRLYVTAETMKNTKALVKHLMKLHGISYSHVIRHFDVTGKKCPECWTYKTVKHPVLYKNLLNKKRWIAFRHYITGVYRYQAKKKKPVRKFASKNGKLVKYIKKGTKVTFAEFSADKKWGETASKNWIHLGGMKKI